MGDLGAEEDFGGITARILELGQAEDPALARRFVARYFDFDILDCQLLDNFVELYRTRNAPAKIGKIVTAISMQRDAVMPFVHSQIRAVAFAFIDIFHAAAAAREALPCSSEEHTSELQSLMRNSYAVLCLTKK